MIRSAVVFAVLLASLLAPRAARADMGMLPNGVTIEWPRLFIADDNGEFKEPADPDALRFYLNHAACTCAQAMPDRPQSKIQYELHLAATTGLQRPVIEMVGPDCVNDASRATQCRQLTETLPSVDELVFTRSMTVNIYDIINNVNIKDTSGMPVPCIVDEAQPQIWAAVDTNATTTIDMADYFSPRPIDLGKYPDDVKGFDTRPPPLPDNLDAAGGENSVTIHWDIPTANFQDLYYYQALCMDATTHQPVHSSGDTPLFKTSAALCGVAETTMLTAAENVGGPNDMAVTAVPTEFAAFDGAFVCGTEMSGQATSLTVNGLENGKPYIVALLAIDRSGNFTGSFFTSTVTPQAVTDLWEDIHDRGGGVEGGLCLLNETYGGDGPITNTLRAFRDDTLATTFYGRALTRLYYATLGQLGGLVHGSIALRVIAGYFLLPLVAIGLLWHFLTLPGLLLLLAAPWLWRRRGWLLRLRAVRFAVAAGALVAFLAPRAARADDFTPYWEEERSEASFGDEDYTVRWHAGIRLGPYTPDIDKQLGVNMNTGIGPYRAMFGNYYTLEGGGLTAHDAHVYQWLPMLDVDRVLWHGFGQLAVGGTLGYMQKSAYPYLDGTSPDEQFRARSTAEKTTFRLIPFALTASYRFTILDELYSIPIVPYVKGGLSYYVWWMTAPSGDLSAVCKNGGALMDCADSDKNKAYGGSLGFQGTVGLAIRAERIDADAARSMQQSGIYHAGFFGELQYAKVDGFGSSSKLSVGGATWFAGVDFEF